MGFPVVMYFEHEHCAVVMAVHEDGSVVSGWVPPDCGAECSVKGKLVIPVVSTVVGQSHIVCNSWLPDVGAVSTLDDSAVFLVVSSVIRPTNLLSD